MHYFITLQFLNYFITLQFHIPFCLLKLYSDDFILLDSESIQWIHKHTTTSTMKKCIITSIAMNMFQIINVLILISDLLNTRLQTYGSEVSYSRFRKLHGFLLSNSNNNWTEFITDKYCVAVCALDPECIATNLRILNNNQFQCQSITKVTIPWQPFLSQPDNDLILRYRHCDIEVQSWGNNDSGFTFDSARIVINGQPYLTREHAADGVPRGILLLQIYPEHTCNVQLATVFDTWKAGTNADALVSAVNAMESGSLVVLATCDDYTSSLYSNGRTAPGQLLLEMGSPVVNDYYEYRWVFKLIQHIFEYWF